MLVENYLLSYSQTDIMNTKVRTKKTKCDKKSCEQLAPAKVKGVEVPVPAKVVASVVGCSTPYVKKMRRGEEVTGTELQQRIQVGEQLLNEGISKVIADTKRTLSKS